MNLSRYFTSYFSYCNVSMEIRTIEELICLGNSPFKPILWSIRANYSHFWGCFCVCYVLFQYCKRLKSILVFYPLNHVSAFFSLSAKASPKIIRRLCPYAVQKLREEDEKVKYLPWYFIFYYIVFFFFPIFDSYIFYGVCEIWNSVSVSWFLI